MCIHKIDLHSDYYILSEGVLDYSNTANISKIHEIPRIWRKFYAFNRSHCFLRFQGRVPDVECSRDSLAWTVRTNRCRESRNSPSSRGRLLVSTSKIARARPTTWRESRKCHQPLLSSSYRIIVTLLPYPSPLNPYRYVKISVEKSFTSRERSNALHTRVAFGAANDSRGGNRCYDVIDIKRRVSERYEFQFYDWPWIYFLVYLRNKKSWLNLRLVVGQRWWRRFSTFTTEERNVFEDAYCAQVGWLVAASSAFLSECVQLYWCLIIPPRAGNRIERDSRLEI